MSHQRVGAVAIAVVLAVAALGVGPVLGQAREPGSPDPRTYRPPVTAPVTDPFRPPGEPWLSGNRGIEYSTRPGTPVRAIGPGVVSFAGPVAGSLHVTVLHPDGLRSSYSYLAVVRARVGDRVDAGQVVGVAAERLHLGVRRGDVYLDPASLWGAIVRGGRVALVPLGGQTSRPAPSPQIGPRPEKRSTGTDVGNEAAPPGRDLSVVSPQGRAVASLGADLAATLERIADLVS